MVCFTHAGTHSAALWVSIGASSARVSATIASPDEFAARLRENHPPIVARIDEGRIVFDPRAVLPAEEEALLAGIERCAKLDFPKLNCHCV